MMRRWSEIQWRGEGADAVCEHGTAIDMHCCNCHSGFLFPPFECVCTFDDDEPEQADTEDEKKAA